MEPFIMQNPNLTLIGAKRNSGKSYLIHYMLYMCAREYNDIYVICPTMFHSDYPKIIGKSRLFSVFNEKMIEDLMKGQAKLTRKGAKNKVLLILDDCISKANFKSNIFTLIATQGRHYQFSCWITSQHYHSLPPVIRLNCDYLMILGNQTVKVMKTIHEELGSQCDDEKEFARILRRELQNYGCFIINNLEGGKFHKIQAPSNIPKFFLSNRKRKA